MEDQGGAGGVPLDDHGQDAERRKPHAERAGRARGAERRTRAADTDEASRLDRPEKRPDPDDPRKDRTEWHGPRGD
ncbi:hypothetical protein [Streptomyces sp. NPDC012888]|uniref:hypothetical protein n=1 Tax=Streptomyces sp. NPDC012888 TaxID=3364855 RepID=UPI003698B9DD